jgi:hypothetical protein
MAKLVTTSNFRNPDDFYALLLKAHEGRSAQESAALNTRLLLLLANHIGDLAVIEEAVDAAMTTIKPVQNEKK